MAYLMLAVGISLLLLCGDVLVRGAVALAVRLGIPSLVIGLTIVAFGTSAPELVVSLRAALAGAPGIAIGNVVGSNIANILLVLGLPAIIASTDCNQPFIRRNTLYVLGASLLFIALCFLGPLTFWHGAILFTLMVAFLIESGRRAVVRRTESTEISEEAMDFIDGVSGLPGRPFLIGLFLVIGLVGLPVGANLTVTSATQIARDLGVSDAAVGLTIVAIGTSLPELATTTAAAMRGHAGLALGSVLGSNMFNILAIMGLTAMVTPVPVPEMFFRMDLWVMLGTVIAVTPFAMSKGHISRWPGAVFVLCYVSYLVMVYAPGRSMVAAMP